MAIITMSREMAALGDEIGQELMQMQGYRVIDRKMIESRFEQYGIGPEKREKYDEKKPSFWASLSQEKDDYLHFLKTVLYEFAVDGNCVILGRGGEAVFAGLPGTLSVRVVSPRAVRVERLMAYFHRDERWATQLIELSDRNRGGFHRAFFDRDWGSAANYQLVINTGALSAAVAAKLILTLKDELITPAAEEAGLRLLADRVLAQKVITAILFEKKIAIHFLEATSEGGDVFLHGVTSYQPAIDAAVAAAKAVPGVKSVRTDMPVVHEFSYPM